MRLIDKDELLREIKRRSDQAADARMGLWEGDFIDFVNDADVVEVPEWIPVTPETMPNVYTTKSDYEEIRVIVAAKGCEKSIPMVYQRACIRGKTVCRWKWVWGRIYDGPEITHWRPFPEPPEVK